MLPAWLLSEYLEAVPQMEAQETLQMATAVTLGSGTMKQGQSQAIMNSLKRQARGRVPARGLIETLASMPGIGFVVEGKPDE